MDPIIKLTSQKSTFKWTVLHEEIFKKVQSTFFSSPFLCLPDFSDRFFLNTNVNAIAIAGILLQERNEDFLPISYFSKTLSPAEVT